MWKKTKKEDIISHKESYPTYYLDYLECLDLYKKKYTYFLIFYTVLILIYSDSFCKPDSKRILRAQKSVYDLKGRLMTRNCNLQCSLL